MDNANSPKRLSGRADARRASAREATARARGYLHFVREFVRHPRQIGAICPSSPVLARRIASLVPPGDGLVLELGPGGGAVTAALLRHGVAAHDLVLLERSAALVTQLSHRFPDVALIHGDAAHLGDYAQLRERPLRAIVSSLPLRSLPRPLVRQILDQIAEVSAPGTRFIQFSYALHDACAAPARGFERDDACLVWRNLPPARVDCYRDARARA
jgi:phospholipid N-methyltransferase